MTMGTFDTLKSARDLEATGLPREQAEAIVDVLYQYKVTLDQERDIESKINVLKLQSETLITRVSDMLNAVADLRSEIVGLKIEVADLKARLRM